MSIDILIRSEVSTRPGLHIDGLIRRGNEMVKLERIQVHMREGFEAEIVKTGSCDAVTI